MNLNDALSSQSVGRLEFPLNEGKVRYSYITGVNFGLTKVFYTAINGLAVFEGDIILGTVERMERIRREVEAIAVSDNQRSLITPERGIAITGGSFRWPEGVIPYQIDTGFPDSQRVIDAINHINAFTNLRLLLRDSEAAYVSFIQGLGCKSPVGMRPVGDQPQQINLGARCDWPRVVHEICHSAGLWHEQSREDRDSYVDYHPENVKIEPGEDHKRNFNQHITDGDDIGAYDYDSIMHYARNEFSIDKDKDTLTPTFNPNREIGQRRGLSAGDVATINYLYPYAQPWHLVGALSPTNPVLRRAFYPPLASVPPPNSGSETWTATQAMQHTDFVDFREERPTRTANGVTVTANVFLDVFINLPSGSSQENGLPPPQIRLHAVDRGWMYVRPATDGSATYRLEIQMHSFINNVQSVPWFGRWVEAGCIPARLIYENVDQQAVQALLNRVPLQSASPNHYFGVSLPLRVQQSDRDAYVQDVLAGRKPVWVQAGAYIGAVASGQAGERHRLRLSARYAAPNEQDAQPMNPRELFHLLFGDDSPEALSHPLFKGISEFAGKQTERPETRRMTLRPPLRTWRRVTWEAQQEVMRVPTSWAIGGQLGSNRLFNNTSSGFVVESYLNRNKSAIFASDICLRAGFRVPVQRVSQIENRWHYLGANAFANWAHAANERDSVSERVALSGLGVSPSPTWGWGLDNWLRSRTIRTPAGEIDRMTALNDAMHREGRCLLLAGTRVPNTPGHIVLLNEVLGQPYLTNPERDDPNDPGRKLRGVSAIKARGVEAGGLGTATRADLFMTRGRASRADSWIAFVRVHVIELHPGKDPDTLQGLADLNVQHRHADSIDLARSALTKVGPPAPATLPSNPGTTPQRANSRQPKKAIRQKTTRR